MCELLLLILKDILEHNSIKLDCGCLFKYPSFMVTPTRRNVITFMIGCHYACYMRELDEIWLKKKLLL